MAYSCIYPSGYTLSTAEQSRYASGKRFTSMALWEAQELSLSDDEDCEIIGGDGSNNWSTAGADTTAVTINWTINGYRISITAIGTARHAGVWDDTRYRLVVSTGAHPIQCDIENITIAGLQIHYTNTSTGYRYPIYIDATGTVDARISKNILRTNTSIAGACFYIYNPGTNSELKFWNNLCYDANPADVNSKGAYFRGANLTTYCYNNTVIGAYRGVQNRDGECHLKNNLSYECGSSAWEGSFNAASTNNASDTDTAESFVSVDLSSYTAAQIFTDPSNDDYSLVSNSPVIDEGTDLSSDPDLSFSDDIAGNSRGATWDIGAFEYVTAGTTVNATTGTSTVESNNAQISVGTTISATLGTSEVQSHNADIILSTIIDATTGQIGVESYPASISVGTTISATLGTSEVSSHNATIDLGTVINATTGQIGIESHNALVSVGTTIDATTGTSEVSSHNAVINLALTINATVGQIGVQSYPASIEAGTEINATVGQIGIESHNATISLPTVINATYGQIGIESYNANIETTTLIEATTGVVTIMSYQAQIIVGEIPIVPDNRILAINNDDRILSITNDNRIYPINT